MKNKIIYGKEGGKTMVGFYDMNENILIEIPDRKMASSAKSIGTKAMNRSGENPPIPGHDRTSKMPLTIERNIFCDKLIAGKG